MSALNRRRFLNHSAKTGLAVAAGGSFLASNVTETNATESKKAAVPKVGAFTKSFQDRSIPEVCRIFNKIGLDGLDLTVRRGGHIEPNDVETELPKAHKAARDAGTEILFLTTGITDADTDAERLLAAAAEIGITKIKLGYYRYTTFGQLAKQMKQTRKRIAKVIKLAAKYNVLPCIHVHSGATLPSHGTQLFELIRDFSPKEVGAYVDPSHMAKEGGLDGWRQGLDILAPWIALCSVKNFAWERSHRDKQGQQRWKTINVPIADGVCPLPDFVAALKKLDFHGPYSMHSEYKGSHSFKNLDTEGCIRQTAVDLEYFRTLL
ncbi:MAG: sugar phosphate isomerase/epimerase [Planctomycetes bacterium]|nr:sugar phosphate isomerase/epimerase [Planctomycetota bacterium]